MLQEDSKAFDDMTTDTSSTIVGVDQEAIPAMQLPQRTALIFEPTEQGSTNGVVIGLRSCDCYAINFPKSHWLAKPPLLTLVYELEPLLPVDADLLGVDLVATPSGWLSLAVDASKYQPLVDDIHQWQRWIATICPIVMLAIDAVAERLPKRGLAIVLWHHAGAIDIVELRDRAVCSWRWIAASDQAIVHALSRITSAEHPAALLAINLDGSLATAAQSSGLASTFETIEADVIDTAKQTANQLILGIRRPRFNLSGRNPDPLDAIAPFRQPLVACFAALSCLLLATVFALLWRAKENLREATRLQGEQETVFTKLFPSEQPPVGLLTRLESEYRQLLVTKGGASDTPIVESILFVYHGFLSGTPEAPRFRWDQIEFAPHKVVRAIGVAKSFGDFEAVGDSLRIAGFKVPPLSAAQVSGGVSMRLDNIEHQLGNASNARPNPAPAIDKPIVSPESPSPESPGPESPGPSS